MKLNDLFDAVIVLNLDRRPERLEEITNELNKLDTKFYRWRAIDNLHTDMTAIFCVNMNLRNILSYAQWKNYNTFLLLNDDCIFTNDFYSKLEQVWSSIPDDWDIISFGDHLIKSTPVNDKIQKIYESYGGHAVAIKTKNISIIYETLHIDNFADISLNTISEKINRYVIEPGLVTQSIHESDLVPGIRHNHIYNLWQ
jgi:hypothetical protein